EREDAALVEAGRRAAPACHTGSISCFAPWLWRTVAERAKDRPPESNVAGLLDDGVAARRRKAGAEGVEVAVAALDESDERVIEEVADLWFHTYVLLAARGVGPRRGGGKTRDRGASR